MGLIPTPLHSHIANDYSISRFRRLRLLPGFVDPHSSIHLMNVTQLTDLQLSAQADKLALEYLATSSDAHDFTDVQLAYDLVVRELTARGRW